MKNFLKIAYSILLKIILFPLRMFPVENDRIIFSGLTGGHAYEYIGNLKYLCEHIDNNDPGYFEIIWLVSEPEHYQSQHRDFLFIKHNSFKAFYHLITAKTIVTSGSYAPWFPFRKNQNLINTWHGGGLFKKIESEGVHASATDKKWAHDVGANVSLFISSGTLATEMFFRKAFAYKGEILEVGSPRNDMLINGNTKDGIQRVREQYQIADDERIVLYAPTYRQSGADIILNGTKLLETLSMGGLKWRILFRTHRYHEVGESIEVSGDNCINVANYPDMQELLAAADMVITDYSSLIWDYSLLNKPGFLYVPDVKDYEIDPGFYLDIDKWPFAAATSNEELLELIKQYDATKAQKRIEDYHQMMGSCEQGQACEKITEWIIKKSRGQQQTVLRKDDNIE